jgi:hypothetical protein
MEEDSDAEDMVKDPTSGNVANVSNGNEMEMVTLAQ